MAAIDKLPSLPFYVRNLYRNPFYHLAHTHHELADFARASHRYLRYNCLNEPPALVNQSRQA